LDGGAKVDVKDVRNSIPALNRRIFLNHAAVSPLPTKAAESMKNFLNDKVRARLTYDVNLEHWMEKARDSKKVLF
jgi:selenocysteine lyase/cysteine desulfurase